MITIKLDAKIPFNSELDLRNLSTINFNSGFQKISRTKVLYRNKERKLGDLFSMEILKNNQTDNELILKGTNKYCNYIGWKWSRGLLIIKSNVGSFLGAKMFNGKIIVEGSAENYVGSQMINGEIFIKTNVKDFLGSSLPGSKLGMEGGTIIIQGEVHDFLGMNMRRGTIFVNKDAGDYCCNNMIAGTVILNKGYGKNLAEGMKRGTIMMKVIKFSKENFFENGKFYSPFLELLRNYLKKEYGIRIFNKKKNLIRYLGDIKTSGKGELIVFKD